MTEDDTIWIVDWRTAGLLYNLLQPTDACKRTHLRAVVLKLLLILLEKLKLFWFGNTLKAPVSRTAFKSSAQVSILHRYGRSSSCENHAPLSIMAHFLCFDYNCAVVVLMSPETIENFFDSRIIILVHGGGNKSRKIRYSMASVCMRMYLVFDMEWEHRQQINKRLLFYVWGCST